MSAAEVFTFAKNMTDAAICLRDGGHHLQAAMLTYVAIDQMAWLSVEGLRTSRKDFMAWVDAYMPANSTLPCTACEIWEARNGVLHMGTAESAANRDSDNIRKICYVFGHTPELANKSGGVVFIRVEQLMLNFLGGVELFLRDLEADPVKMTQAKGKLDRMLTQRLLSPQSQVL